MSDKNKYLNLKGKAMWARIFEDNRDMNGWEGNARETDGQYTMNLLLDDEGLYELQRSGSQAADFAKATDDGLHSVKFKRPHVKTNKSGDILEWAGGPPKVVHADGKTKWDFEEDGAIGNGSEVEVRINVYKAGRVGTRLEAIRIIDLVEAPTSGGWDID